jgi:mRNA interferase YafQ
MFKRGYNLDLLDYTVQQLASGIPLPGKYRDHALSGNWTGYRECHITPDWLLVYRIKNDILVLMLTRTGSHSDLF